MIIVRVLNGFIVIHKRKAVVFNHADAMADWIRGQYLVMVDAKKPVAIKEPDVQPDFGIPERF